MRLIAHAALALPALLAAALAHAAPAAPAIEQQSRAAASAGSFFQVLIGLIVVLGLLAAIAWILKRFNLARAGAHAPVKIVGGVSVGTRERVVVVEVAGQWIVVGVASGSVNALANLPRPGDIPETAAPETAPTGNFADWLKTKIEQRNAR